MSVNDKSEVKNIAVNRKARHDYYILDTCEVGLVLKGTEETKITLASAGT